jgi:hypothetical protein
MRLAAGDPLTTLLAPGATNESITLQTLLYQVGNNEEKKTLT